MTYNADDGSKNDDSESGKRKMSVDENIMMPALIQPQAAQNTKDVHKSRV